MMGEAGAQLSQVKTNSFIFNESFQKQKWMLSINVRVVTKTNKYNRIVYDPVAPVETILICPSGD